MLCVASLAAAPLLAALQGCANSGPRAIAYGRDQCGNCRMMISDPRYAAELVTARGRTLVFDSIECLASFVLHNEAAPSAARTAVGSLWVAAHRAPNTLLPAEHSWFRQESGPGSPMGKGLTAFATEREARSHGEMAGSPLVWRDVFALVAREGLRQGDGNGTGG